MSVVRSLRAVLRLGVAATLAATTLVIVEAAPASAACPTVRSGSHGSCVLTLQRRLAALRYDMGPADGIFGPQTMHAVIAFQKVNGLSRTGVVTSSVWYRLYHGTVVPKPRYARSGSAIEVNLTRQVLYRIAGGSIVGIYDTSTGRPSLPTPVSWSRAFKIWKKARWGSTGYNDSEPYVQYFYRGTLLAIHGYGYVPTYPASHGCIRLHPSAAARLYGATYVGERVYTYK